MSMTAEQLLAGRQTDFFSIDPGTTVGAAIRTFSEQNVGALLVCHNECLVGVLSERDCVRRVLAHGLDAELVSVRDVMTPHPFCVAPSDDIERCMALMNAAHVRHLPVVEGGRVRGVIRMRDVMLETLREREYLIEELEGYISGSPSARPPSARH